MSVVSLPMPACSPGPPTLAPRAPPTVSHDAPGPVGVVTHKEWVVPPRPKPGRKPATDIPPTKRKAQNRAAQRAFRERRAARVNELEDQLKVVELGNAARLTEYQNQVNHLARINAELAKENSHNRTKAECLQKELELLQQNKADPQQQQPQTSIPNFSLTQVASPAPSLGHETSCGINCPCTDELDNILCDKGPMLSDLPAPTLVSSVPINHKCNRNRPDSELPESPDPPGCGHCLKDCNSVCITEIAATIYPAKRPTSPSERTPKRARINYNEFTPPDDLATDFTTAYTVKPLSARSSFSTPPVIPLIPADPCGFCSDGTHCVCAEAANSIMSMEDDTDSEELHSTKLPPLLSSHTPPPTGDLEGLQQGKPVALHPPMTKRMTGAASGCQPGGCTQCKNDPMSTLFCQSVATKVKSRTAGVPAGCCGGGCYGDNAAKPPPSSKGASEEKGTFIPCSAAYQALSRHRGFEEATADLGSLLRPLMVRSSDGRCPQIEVSSVSDVLKQLDRRFGSDVA